MGPEGGQMGEEQTEDIDKHIERSVAEVVV